MAGSHSYGTNHAESDVDVKGVCVSPRIYRDGFAHRFEQADGKEHLLGFRDLMPAHTLPMVDKEGIDGVVFGLPKFMSLASDCNPNVVEMLFTDDSDVLVCSQAGAVLRQNRLSFLSQRALATFRGYSLSQMHRIKTHRKWLLDPPKAKPTRAEFGLPEKTVIPGDQLQVVKNEIQRKLDSWEIDFGDTAQSIKIQVMEQLSLHLAELQIGSNEKFLAAGRVLGYEENFLDLLRRERLYETAHKGWVQYNEWKTKRNPKRAKMEAAFGYDGKHAMHLVRLLRMCREILTEGRMLVRRPDVQELLGVMRGEWTFDQLVDWAEVQYTELGLLADKSALPKNPPLKVLDELCMELTRMVEDSSKEG